MSTEKSNALNVSEITEAVNAAEFDKAVEMTNAIPEDGISPEDRKELLDAIEAKKKEVAEPNPDAKPPETGKKGEVKEPDSGKVEPSTAEHIKLEEDFQLAQEGGNLEKMEELVEQVGDEDTFKEYAIGKIEEIKKARFDASISEVTEAMDAAEFDKAEELAKGLTLSDAEKKKVVERVKLRGAVTKAMAAGHHNKATELVKKLADDDQFKVDVLESVKKIKEAAKNKDKSVRPPRQPKEINTDDIFKKWDALIDILAKYLLQQRKAGKAWRHINQVHTIIKQHSLRFKRNLPK